MKKLLLTMLLASPFTTHANETLTETAIFAGGCFWCIQHDYADYEEQGFLKTEVGYTGGTLPNPTYEQVSKENTGHYEALRIKFDPTKVTYTQLLNRFWPNVDATDAGGQFCDRGDSYRAAIFATESQRPLAEESKQRAQTALGDKHQIVTPILPATTFYVGEDYHQHYATKNPIRYKYYRFSCGRDQQIKKLWGDTEDL